MYGVLVKDPFRCSDREIGRLTDRQIRDVYLRKRPDPEEEIREPETEEDLRAVLKMFTGGMDQKEAKKEIERQVEKWKASRGEVGN